MVNSMLALTGYTEGPYRLCFNSWYLIDVQLVFGRSVPVQLRLMPSVGRSAKMGQNRWQALACNTPRLSVSSPNAGPVNQSMVVMALTPAEARGIRLEERAPSITTLIVDAMKSASASSSGPVCPAELPASAPTAAPKEAAALAPARFSGFSTEGPDGVTRPQPSPFASGDSHESDTGSHNAPDAAPEHPTPTGSASSALSAALSALFKSASGEESSSSSAPQQPQLTAGERQASLDQQGAAEQQLPVAVPKPSELDVGSPHGSVAAHSHNSGSSSPTERSSAAVAAAAAGNSMFSRRLSETTAIGSSAVAVVAGSAVTAQRAIAQPQHAHHAHGPVAGGGSRSSVHSGNHAQHWEGESSAEDALSTCSGDALVTPSPYGDVCCGNSSAPGTGAAVNSSANSFLFSGSSQAQLLPTGLSGSNIDGLGEVSSLYSMSGRDDLLSGNGNGPSPAELLMAAAGRLRAEDLLALGGNPAAAAAQLAAAAAAGGAVTNSPDLSTYMDAALRRMLLAQLHHLCCVIAEQLLDVAAMAPEVAAALLRALASHRARGAQATDVDPRVMGRILQLLRAGPAGRQLCLVSLEQWVDGLSRIHKRRAYLDTILHNYQLTLKRLVQAMGHQLLNDLSPRALLLLTAELAPYPLLQPRRWSEEIIWAISQMHTMGPPVTTFQWEMRRALSATAEDIAAAGGAGGSPTGGSSLAAQLSGLGLGGAAGAAGVGANATCPNGAVPWAAHAALHRHLLMGLRRIQSRFFSERLRKVHGLYGEAVDSLLRTSLPQDVLVPEREMVVLVLVLLMLECRMRPEEFDAAFARDLQRCLAVSPVEEVAARLRCGLVPDSPLRMDPHKSRALSQLLKLGTLGGPF
eukprot:XP_001701933.1 predicted protein [Chlamydomonas reinhardtii]